MKYEELRYDQVRQKSIHNAFQRHEGILDQFAYWRIRSFEVDIHRAKPYRDDLRGDWYVYHAWPDSFTSVDRLSQFLELLRGMHAATPQHEVITAFLDVKDPFHATASASHSWRALDDLLRKHLGRWIYSPADLLAHGDATTLQDAVENGWPKLADLRGRFVIVLTGSDEDLDVYAGTDRTARNRLAFVSRRVTADDEIPGPSQVVFYNMPGTHVRLASKVHHHGLMSRAYYVDEEQIWDRAVQFSCHHIATDKANAAEDAWSTTFRENGWPFTPLVGQVDPVTEPGEVCGIWTESGDIWKDRDSFYFHFRHCPANARSQTYEFLVSSPNSEVEDWAKAGLMARESLAPGSPYFAVLRIGEKSALRVQFRVEKDRPTVATEFATPKGYDPDTLMLVKLVISDDGRHAEGFASVAGRGWTRIAECGFDRPLPFQGLAVSSHGGRGGAKFLFGTLRDQARPRFDAAQMVGGQPGQRGWHDWDGIDRWKVREWDPVT